MTVKQVQLKHNIDDKIITESCPEMFRTRYRNVFLLPHLRPAYLLTQFIISIPFKLRRESKVNVTHLTHISDLRPCCNDDRDCHYTWIASLENNIILDSPVSTPLSNQQAFVNI